MTTDQFIGHYRIISELGRGGMGVVYKAHEESLNRYVAIKVLGEHLTDDAGYVERFLREARAAAKLNHPNIVQIYFIGQDGEKHFFVMEYVKGRSVQSLVRSEGKMAPVAAARIILQAASGLAAAHSVGIIHRDIKPANLMLDERGLVKIADFGLALAPEAASRLTATGMFMGTPGYLSPEQCLNEKVDNRADIYALGVTFFEMLTAKVPFKAESPLALLRLIVEVEPPDVRELNPNVDDGLREILAKMMAKDPEQRYANCHRLVADLQQWLTSHAGAATEGFTAAGAAVDAMAASASVEGATQLNADATVAVEGGSGASPGPAPPQAPVTPPPPPPAPAPAAAAAVAPPVLQPQTASTKPGTRDGGQRTVVTALVIVLVLIALAATAGVVAWRTGFLGRAWAALAGGRPEAVEVVEVSGPENEALPPGAPAEPPIVETAGGTALSDRGQAPAAFDGGAAGSPPETVAEGKNPSSARGGEGTASAVAPGRQAESANIAPAGPGASGAAAARDTSAVVAPAPAAPRPTGTAVVFIGEPLLGGEVESYLESELASAGVELFDEKTVPEMVDLLDSQQARLTDVLGTLQEHAGKAVLVRVDFLGERPLRYMGRVNRAYQSRVTMVVMDLSSGEALAPSVTRKVEYTEVQTHRTAVKTLRRLVPKVVELVR